MTKQTLLALGVVLLAAALGGLVFFKQQKPSIEIEPCPTDVMMCPDGSEIPRIAPSCEFGVCMQELPSYLQTEDEARKNEESPAVEKDTVTSSQKKTIETKPSSSTFFGKAKNFITQVSSSFTGSVSNSVTEGIQETSSVVTSNTKAQNTEALSSQTPKPYIDETRYTISENTIISTSSSTVYTLPPSVLVSLGSSGSTGQENWETHIVNVVPVGEVTPVVGAIKVEGAEGKYYISQNSFGNIEACEFSNKIFILDTKTNETTLLYEENSSTLSKDDQRACNSEIYLLATSEEKLILKYHTVNTNMVCESTWSEPEKTWYLDVTKLTQGMRRYLISSALYTQAENEETLCRQEFEQEETVTATTTP